MILPNICSSDKVDLCSTHKTPGFIGTRPNTFYEVSTMHVAPSEDVARPRQVARSADENRYHRANLKGVGPWRIDLSGKCLEK